MHGTLAMTAPGDTRMATIKEVETVMKGKRARAARQHRQSANKEHRRLAGFFRREGIRATMDEDLLR